jgi:hypothetical protein
MTGVEILASEEVAITFGFCWGVLLLMACAGLAIGIMCFLGGRPGDGHIAASIIVFIIMTAVGCAMGFGVDGAPIEHETQYKVTISDEVSMNEFLEHYEIIDQEGKIFTVRERE